MTRFDQGSAPVPPPPQAVSNGHVPQPPGTAVGVPGAPMVLREASAPRRWTVKGLAVAVICVVLGGLVVMVGVQSFARRDTVLVIARPVAVGSRIGAADLTTATITTDPALSPIPDGDRSAVIGKVALVGLSPGTLVTRAEIGTNDGFTVGQVLVPLGLKQGQFPARGLSAGQSVLVVATPASSSPGAGSPAGTSGPGTPGVRAVVAEVAAADATTGVTVVDVRVPAGAAVGLAQLAATGAATVLLLPAGR